MMLESNANDLNNHEAATWIARRVHLCGRIIGRADWLE